PADRHRRDRLAARSRQPHRPGGEFWRDHGAALALPPRGIDEVDRQGRDGDMRSPLLWRLLVLAGFIGLLGALCLGGVIKPLTMQPPHKIVTDLVKMLASGSLNGAIAKTLGNALIAFIIAMALGVTSAIFIHRLRRVRDTLEPLFATYYAIPVF